MILDLPDFDSVETAHRLEVDRVVALADLVVWVVEPQKYADAALHGRYLRPLASHAAAMAVVLNQADLLPATQVEALRNDMERLLAQDGLRDVPVTVVSARTGDGLPTLRRLLAERVAAHDAAVERLAADVDVAARALGAACGGGGRTRVGRKDHERLTATLEDAAGVPHIVRAVGAAHLRRGVLATGWPFVRWLRRFRPDPMRRLRLPESPRPAARTSMAPPTDVQRAQVATAARRVADAASDGLPPPWPTLIRDTVATVDDAVAERLDRAVAGADLYATAPGWWKAAGAASAPARPRRRDGPRLAARARRARVSPARRRCAGSGGQGGARADMARGRRRGGGHRVGPDGTTSERRRCAAPFARSRPLASCADRRGWPGARHRSGRGRARCARALLRRRGGGGGRARLNVEPPALNTECRRGTRTHARANRRSAPVSWGDRRVSATDRDDAGAPASAGRVDVDLVTHSRAHQRTAERGVG